MHPRSTRRPTRASRCALPLALLGLSLLGLSLLAPPAAWAAADDEAPDVVTLKGGREIEGHIVFMDDEVVVLRRGSRDTEYEREKLESVRCAYVSQGELFDAIAASDPRDVEQNLDLMRRASEAGLTGESRVLAWRVLAVDPDNEAAHEHLEHRKRGSRWVVRIDTKSYPMDQLLEVTREWGSEWTFETTHFELRSNADLDTALRMALDLERIYRGFFDHFQGELRFLHWTGDRMPVHAHGDHASYPNSGEHLGYFTGSDFTVRLDVSQGYRPEILAHELCHQLLYFTSQRERTFNGALPGWLTEGLALLVESAAQVDEGRLSMVWGEPNPAHFRVQARSDDPYGLTRVLNFGGSDFRHTEREGLKYSQAYNLVFYCLHGGDEERRERFLGFVRDAYQGKASSTHFEKALEIADEDDWEEAWFAWVAERAAE